MSNRAGFQEWIIWAVLLIGCSNWVVSYLLNAADPSFFVHMFLFKIPDGIILGSISALCQNLSVDHKIRQSRITAACCSLSLLAAIATFAYLAESDGSLTAITDWFVPTIVWCLGLIVWSSLRKAPV